MAKWSFWEIKKKILFKTYLEGSCTLVYDDEFWLYSVLWFQNKNCPRHWETDTSEWYHRSSGIWPGQSKVSLVLWLFNKKKKVRNYTWLF